MRAAVVTTGFVILALVLWSQLREAALRTGAEDGRAIAVREQGPPALPDVSAPPTAPPRDEPTYQPATDQAAAREHVVVAGETLADIAARYYGDASRGPEIYAANRDRIRDPERLYAGQTLSIP